MSVPKSKQGLSDLAFYKNCMDIRSMLINLMLRDFGMKAKKMNLSFAEKIYQISDEDKTTLESICDKYGMNNKLLVSSFPEWLIERDRNILLTTIDEMVKHIITANSIYPTCEQEKVQRRGYQNLAISHCFTLKDKLLDCLKIYNGNAKKTRFTRINDVFIFLKIRYTLTDTGKIIKRLHRNNITRERHKLKKYAKSNLSYKTIENAYKSWRGSNKKYNSYRTIRSMDNLYDELFVYPYAAPKTSVKSYCNDCRFKRNKPDDIPCDKCDKGDTESNY